MIETRKRGGGGAVVEGGVGLIDIGLSHSRRAAAGLDRPEKLGINTYGLLYTKGLAAGPISSRTLNAIPKDRSNGALGAGTRTAAEEGVSWHVPYL